MVGDSKKKLSSPLTKDHLSMKIHNGMTPIRSIEGGVIYLHKCQLATLINNRGNINWLFGASL
jgi:hypothetical protein